MRKLVVLLALSTAMCHGQSISAPQASVATFCALSDEWGACQSSGGGGSINIPLSAFPYPSASVATWCQVSGSNQWSPCPSAIAGVTSFKSRTGAVVPASGDYTAAQVGAIPTSSAPTSAIVGVNDTQLLANKTLAGDATSTPSSWKQITSTNSGSTTNIPVGYGCSIEHTFVSGTSYTSSAICTDLSGNTFIYSSPALALGSETYTSRAEITVTGQIRAGLDLFSPSDIHANSSITTMPGAVTVTGVNQTVAINSNICTISGAGSIQTITNSTISASVGLTISVLASGAWSTVAGGNIATVMTATANTLYSFTWTGSSWWIR